MSLLKRTHNPTGKKYTFYKSFLRIDFEYRCAYCKNREVNEGGSKKFHIDHYKPKNKYPDLADVYTNLFYSCSECNCSKGVFWPSFIDKLKNHYILNPCDHDFEQHYNMTHPEWRGNTSAALWNIQRLRLNSPKRIQFRKDEASVYKLIKDLLKNKIALENTLSSNKLSDSLRTNAKAELVELEEMISILNRKTFDPLE